MRVFWTAVAVLVALLVQTAVSQVAPDQARAFDPFLLVLVYGGLTGGEIQGMLAGAAAGWVQDIHFGGPVVGLSGLTKMLVGFLVGAAGTRFLLVGTAPRILVLLGSTLLDSLIFERFAAVFDIQAYETSITPLLSRATINAVLGAAVFELVDRRFKGEALS